MKREATGHDRRVVRRISSSVFVGRVGERAQLVAGLDAAEHAEPGLVLLGGEAGIGKTRLVAELAAVARSRGTLMVRGHCLEATSATTPFAPFIEILRHLLLGDRASGAAGPDLAVLGRLVPELLSRPDVHRTRAHDVGPGYLFRAVHELLARIAEERPLLVVVEDLHWADGSSLDLFRFVAEALDAERLLIVGTFRTDEVHRRHPLLSPLSELVRLPHVLRLDLAALTLPEVADQLTSITGSRPPDDVVDRVATRADGNPFYVEELAGERADTSLSATLRDVLAARLAMLSTAARAVVLASAAVGRGATQELLARVVAAPPEELLDALREAVDHHVLEPSDSGGAGFAFRHALIREVAYEELLPSERIALHRAIVTVLQETGGEQGEIARHAFLGHDVPTGVACSVAAADRAVEKLAYAEALAHIEHALEFWGDVSEPESLAGRDEASLLTLAAHCAGALGRWRRAADLGQSALILLEPEHRRDDRILALVELSRWESFADNEVARAAAIQEAAAIVAADPPSALRARVLTDLAHLANSTGRMADAQRLAEEAIKVAREVGARAEEARALVRLAECLGNGLQPEAGERLLEEADRITGEMEPTNDDFAGHLVFRHADFALSAGAYGRAIAIVDGGMIRASREGRLGERAGFLRVLKISALIALGRWDEAETLVREATKGADAVTTRMATQDFVEVLIRQGRTAQAAAAVRATDSGYVTSEEASTFLLARIRVAIGEGRWDEARASTDEAVGLSEDPWYHFAALTILELGVSGEADRADVARGRRRAAEEADARQVGLGRVARIRHATRQAIGRGGAGRLIEAVLATAEAEGSRLERTPNPDLWDDAAGQREALGQPWETAYARFRQAEAILATAGDRQHATRLLRDAAGIAARLGARPLLDQIERLARRGRIALVQVPARRNVVAGTTEEGVHVALTMRECETLSLVAAGHTNREIGEQLFISEKTASVHISNAMDKLGALSRYEAAAIATRIGLLVVPLDRRALT